MKGYTVVDSRQNGQDVPAWQPIAFVIVYSHVEDWFKCFDVGPRTFVFEASHRSNRFKTSEHQTFLTNIQVTLRSVRVQTCREERHNGVLSTDQVLNTLRPGRNFV